MKASVKNYIIGFVLSLVLTFGAFSIVLSPASFHMPQPWIVPVILAIAVIQLFIQLVFFMHLGAESGSRWRLAMLVSTIGIILIIVIGSLWIMNHLNYNMMASPSEMNAYIQSQDGL